MVEPDPCANNCSVNKNIKKVAVNFFMSLSFEDYKAIE